MPINMRTYRENLLAKLTKQGIETTEAKNILQLFEVSFHEDITAHSFCGAVKDLAAIYDEMGETDEAVKGPLWTCMKNVAEIANKIDPDYTSKVLGPILNRPSELPKNVYVGY